MKIKNLEALKERIEEYKKMFPNTYTTLEDIYDTFKNHPCSGYCGISVSNEEGQTNAIPLMCVLIVIMIVNF